MTTNEKVARRKRSLLELATELGNVSKACRVMGYSRQQFYEIRRNFQTFGAEGVLDRIAGARAPHPNRVGAAIEQAILDHALAHPCHGPMRVAPGHFRGSSSENRTTKPAFYHLSAAAQWAESQRILRPSAARWAS